MIIMHTNNYLGKFNCRYMYNIRTVTIITGRYSKYIFPKFYHEIVRLKTTYLYLLKILNMC